MLGYRLPAVQKYVVHTQKTDDLIEKKAVTGGGGGCFNRHERYSIPLSTVSLMIVRTTPFSPVSDSFSDRAHQSHIFKAYEQRLALDFC